VVHVIHVNIGKYALSPDKQWETQSGDTLAVLKDTHQADT